MSQMERIFFINRRMQKYGYLNTRDTATLFEVNERTIRRDIEYMRDRIDAPIVYDHKRKGYIYSESYKILEHMDEKMLILYSLIKGMLKGIKYLPVMSDDILKNLSQTLSPEYSELANLIHYEHTDYRALNISFFERIFSAMVTKNPLRIFYSNLKGERSKRKLDPLKMINYSGQWYLVGHCYKANDFRLFSLKRITYIEVVSDENSDRYNIHEVDKMIEGNFGIFKNRETFKSRLKFTGSSFYLVKDQLWHPEERREVDDEKRELILELPISDSREVLGKVLSFGGDAEVLEPKSLRDEWLGKIEEMYKRFH